MSSKTNRWRVDQATKGLEAFAEGKYGDLSDPDCLEKAMADMLCNLMHLAQLRLHLPGERSFDRVLENAKEIYSIEKMERESDDSPYRFGGLRPVDKETFKENYDFLKDSGIGYANDSTESILRPVYKETFKENYDFLKDSGIGYANDSTEYINALMLDTFVQGNLVLRAATLGSGTTRQCDLVFFRHLRDKGGIPTGGGAR